MRYSRNPIPDKQIASGGVRQSMQKLHTVTLQTAFTLVASATLLLFPCSVMANGSVAGRYLQSSGNTIRLELTIRPPAPQNLILQQQIPPGTQVLSTSPKASKIGQRDGVVKWLFKGVSPGKLEVVMKLRPAVPTGAVHGSFRYRMPNGVMQEGHIGR